MQCQCELIQSRGFNKVQGGANHYGAAECFTVPVFSSKMSFSKRVCQMDQKAFIRLSVAMVLVGNTLCFAQKFGPCFPVAPRTVNVISCSPSAGVLSSCSCQGAVSWIETNYKCWNKNKVACGEVITSLFKDFPAAGTCSTGFFPCSYYSSTCFPGLGWVQAAPGKVTQCF